MDSTAGVVAVAFAIVLVVLGIVGAVSYDNVLDKRKDLRQFELCVGNGGTYLKAEHNRPLCVQSGSVRNLDKD